MNLTTLGIDLAKTSFSLVGMDQHGKVVLRKTLSRAKLLPFIAQCPTCLIGMEACSGAHYWAREFTKPGHKVGIIIMACKFIAPFRKGSKNDNNGLPMLARQMISNLWDRIKIANEQVLFYDRELHKQAHHHPVAKRLLTIPGVGEQVASAVVTSVPDQSLFKDSRQFAAWFGLVPRQHTTGENVRLGRITKQGDRYLRMCLVHGARSVLANLKDKQDKISCWARELIARRGYLRAVVAMAARNARLIWTLMVKQEDYKVIAAN